MLLDNGQKYRKHEPCGTFQEALKFMVDNIYPFNNLGRGGKHQEALRESLQDTKKLCTEAEPRPSASIHTEEESEETSGSRRDSRNVRTAKLEAP